MKKFVYAVLLAAVLLGGCKDVFHDKPEERSSGNNSGNNSGSRSGIIYDANGASGTVPSAETVNDGTRYTIAGKGGLTFPGKTFNGWNTKPGGTGVAYAEGSSIIVTAPLYLYAQWKDTAPTSYTVTFDPAGGTVTPTTIKVKPGESIPVLPTPTKESNTFGGWYTQTAGGGTVFTASTPVNGDMTVYAKWTAVAASQYTVTFDPAGGTVETPSLKVNPGERIPILPRATRDGYNFGGWYTQKDGGGTGLTIMTPVTGDMTFYAKWTASGGTGGTGTIEVVNSDTSPVTTINRIIIYNDTKTDIIKNEPVSLSTYGSKETFTVPSGDYIVEVFYGNAGKQTSVKFTVLANGLRRVTLLYSSGTISKRWCYKTVR